MSDALPFDFGPLLARGTPPPAAQWRAFPKYNFVGGHNDCDLLPVDALAAAASRVLEREGKTLSTYGLESGPLGYRPLREFLVDKLHRSAGIRCRAEEILITSGSLQAIDLINAALLEPGDTVIIEQANYGGVLTRFVPLGVKPIGLPLDDGGMQMDALSAALDDCKRRGVKPKYIYTIPTIQNPTATIMSEARRRELLALAASHGVPVFEDDCYADLIWSGVRPPAIHALCTDGRVIHIGSFSKSVAPALRVGFIVARWEILSRILALKTDAGSGALEQMVLAEFCKEHFAAHVPRLNKALHAKLETLMEALAEQFGTAAEFEKPPGGIFLWVKLPDCVDIAKLAQVALAEGVAINPGPEWAIDRGHAHSRMRLCYANPSHDTIRAGVGKLAEICSREFGVPVRRANVMQ